MKSVALPLCVIGLAMACLLPAAELGNVRTVYLLPMANGFDQHLAHHLADAGVFQVVVDPRKADAVFTDKLGEGLQTRLNEMLAEPGAKKEGSAKEAAWEPATFQPLGHGKGNLFLVEMAGRTVVWSVFEPPRDTTAKELDRAAKRVVSRLKSPSTK